MFKEFHTKDKRAATSKFTEWLNENPLPNKIEIVSSDKGFSLSVLDLALENESLTRSLNCS
jgi:hypothetical protein